MKKTLSLLTALGLTSITAEASVSFGGNAFVNVPGISVGDVAYFIVDINGVGFDSFASENSPFTAGANLSDISSFGNGNYVFLPNGADFSGKKSATAVGPVVTLGGGFVDIQLANGISVGDKFAVIVFSNSTDTALAGDTYTVWSDPTWVIPADGSALSFSTTEGAPLRSLTASATPLFSGVVSAIPEPSAFAAIAGLGILGFAATRRKRSA